MSIVSDSIQPITKHRDDSERQLQYGERETGGAFTCSHCRRKVPASEPMATTVSIIEDGVAIEIDGAFCSENCAHDEAMEAILLDTK